MDAEIKYIELLKSELLKRKSLNPQYSLRQFALDLGIHAASLSGIMKGQRPFPVRRGPAVAKALKVNPEIFLEASLMRPHERKKNNLPTKTLSLDKEIEMIEDWEYYAILNYLSLPNCNSQISHIAQTFGLTSERVSLVIEKLIQSGFVEKRAGQLIRTVEALRTPEDTPSSSLKKAHTVELELAQKKMMELDPLHRDFSSIMFTGNSKQMKNAKKLIRSFRQKLNRCFTRGVPDQVYLFSMQLFPLTADRRSGK